MVVQVSLEVQVRMEVVVVSDDSLRLPWELSSLSCRDVTLAGEEEEGEEEEGEEEGSLSISILPLMTRIMMKGKLTTMMKKTATVAMKSETGTLPMGRVPEGEEEEEEGVPPAPTASLTGTLRKPSL